MRICRPLNIPTLIVDEAVHRIQSCSMIRAARSRHSALLGGILLLGAALRLYGLDIQSLWRDEASTLHYATRESLGETFQFLAGEDVHPPLNNILYFCWVKLFGSTVHSFRGLSAIFGTVSIYLVYAIGRRLSGRHPARIAAMLHALALMQIYYSQEGRSYAMLVALTLASMQAFLMLVERRTQPAAAYYVLASAALLYTHSFGLLVLLAQSGYMGLRLSLGLGASPAPGERGRVAQALRWMGLQGLVALLYAPWIPTLLGQIDSPARSWILEPSLATVGKTVLIYLSAAKPPWGYPSPDWMNIVIAFAAGAALLVAAAFAFPRTADADRDAAPAWDRRERTLFLGLWLVLPIATAWLISISFVTIYTHRNLIICAPALSLLLAAEFVRVRSAPFRMLLLAAILAPALGHLPWYYGTIHKEDWRGAQAFIQESFRPTDQVVVAERGPLSWLPGTYYLDKERLRGVNPEATVDLRRQTPRAQRLWTIAFRPAAPDRRLLALGYAPTAEREFHDGVMVVLYERRAQ